MKFNAQRLTYVKPSDVVFVACACIGCMPEGLVLDAMWHVNHTFFNTLNFCHCLLFVPTEYFHFKPKSLCCNSWTLASSAATSFFIVFQEVCF